MSEEVAPAAGQAPVIAWRNLLPWLALAAMLLIAGAQGLEATRGMARPPDQDVLRDLGYMQAILDGNWWGDPVYPGELRWYPPLIPLLGAAAGRLVGGDLPAFWLAAGPWLNLAVMALFFMMARRLFGTETAAMATALYLFVDSHIGRPWVSGGYTPWPLTPSLTSGLFFASVWLIHARAAVGRWRDAVAIGAAIGLVALAHTVPGLLLSVIVTAATFATRRVQPRAILWLAVVAAIQLAMLAPFVLPLWWRYRLHVANAVPGGYVTDVLRPEYAWFAAPIGAAMLATFAGAWLLRRFAPVGRPLGRVTLAILLAWILPCAIMLARHFACRSAGGGGGACGVFVVAAHHWSLYLTLGWTLAAGYVLASIGKALLPGHGPVLPSFIAMLLGGGGVAVIAGFALLVGDPTAETRDPTADVRNWAMAADGRETDWDAYRWIIANTAPGDTFVTDGSDPAAFSVIPAGRALVAAPVLHSSPYVNWRVRESHRQELLAAATGHATPTQLCANDPLWLLLPVATNVDMDTVETIFTTQQHVIYWTIRRLCTKP